MKNFTMSLATPIGRCLNCLFFILILCLSVLPLTAQQPAANLDQVRNGPADMPVDPGNWQNGNLGKQTSHFVESMSIPYRVVMTNMPANTVVTLILGYDVKHSGKHALDYLTNYDRIQPHQLGYGHDQEEIDPTIGTAFSEPPHDVHPIPPPPVLNTPVMDQPTNSFTLVSDADGANMAMWNGDITNITYGPTADLSLEKDEQRINVTFTTGPTAKQTIILAWGGHIASRDDWGFLAGVPRSAGGISGSPYHMRLINWNLNNLGNQDRSLSADAVLPPPDCELEEGPAEVCQETVNVYTVATSNAPNPSYSWELIDNTSNAFIISGEDTESVTVNSGDTGGAYTIQVTVSDINGVVICATTVGVFATPEAPTTTPDSRCGPGVVDLSAANCDDGALTWYDAAVDGNVVATGPNFSPNLTMTTTYWVSCKVGPDCEGPRQEVTGTIQPIPPAPTTTGDSRCGPGIVDLSASGCDGGTLKWYDAAVGGAQVNTGPNYSPDLNATTSFWVSCTSAAGCDGPRKQVTGEILSDAAAPTTTDDDRCGPGAVNLSASGCANGTLQWYDAAVDGNLVNTGTDYAPNLNSTTSFWVSCLSNDGCESPRTQVTGTIFPIPPAPETTSDSRCGPGVVDLSASGCPNGTLKWYDSAMNGTQVATGPNFSPNLNTTTSYWVSCTSADGCEGERTEVTGTILDIPAAPTTTGDDRCGPGVVDLIASGCDGGTLKWYDAAMGGNHVATGPNFSPDLNATTSYWVSCTSADGCEGPRAEVTGTIFDIPAAPNTTGDERCGPGVVHLSASGCANGTLMWYNQEIGGMLAAMGTNYSPNLNATTSYWVSCLSNDGCEGPRQIVTGIVNDIPAAPETTDAQRCGPGVVNLSASGCPNGTLKWYDAAINGTQVATGPNFSPNLNSTTSYWVSCTSAQGCEGERTIVTGTILDVPGAPTTTGDDRCGPGVVNLSASGCDGGILKWYDAAANGAQVATGPNFSPDLNATTSYWVSCTLPGDCEGPRAEVIGTIFNIPTAPETTGDERCGPGVVNLSASGCANGTLMWYDQEMNGNLVAMGTNYSPNLNATTSFWVSCLSNDGCAGPRQIVTGIVHDIPPAPETTDDEHCGPGVVNLSASGCPNGTLTWYDAEEDGNVVNTGPDYSPELAVTTVFWVSCTNSDGCEGLRAPVTGVIFSRFDAPVVEEASHCGPGQVDLVADGCEGGTINWYDAEENGNLVATGPTYSPVLNTTTTFWVSCTSEDECEGPVQPVTAVVFSQIELTEVEGDSRCGPGVVDLTATGCEGGTINWYDAEEDGNLVANGPNYSPNLGSTTTFWVSCTSSEGCEGPRTAVTGTILGVPEEPGTTGDSRCGAGVVALSATGCPGGVLTWYDAAEGGMVVNTGSNYFPALNTTTSFWVSCTTEEGCEGPRSEVTGVINGIPEGPTTTGDSRCGPGVVELSATGCPGGTLTWYDAAMGGAVVNTGPDYSPDLGTTTSFWVSCTTAEGCEGPRTKVTGTIFAIPSAPITTGDSRCGPGVVMLSAAGCNGGTLKWYDAADNGTQVATGPNFSPELNSTTSYWVSCISTEGCEGPRAKVTGTILPIPPAPSTVGDSRCGPGVVTLKAGGCDGGTLKWYNAAEGGSVVFEGTEFSPNLNSTTSYWVSCTSAAGCEGPRRRVKGRIFPIPSAPATVGDSRCGPGVVNLSASGCDGGTLKWYDAAEGGSVVNTGPEYAPELNTTTNFWVSCTSNKGCEGPRKKVTGTIHGIPEQPSVTGDSRCGPGVVNLSAGGCEGGTLTWYDAPIDGEVVETGPDFAPEISETTSYWVSCTSSDGCEGPLAEVVGTVFDVPAAPMTTSDDHCGPGVVELSASGCEGGTLTWYDAAEGGNVVNVGPNYAPELETTTNFWVSCTNSDLCEGPRAPVTGVIFARFDAPVVEEASHCGPGVVDLVADGCEGGTINWYDAEEGGELVATGPTYSPELTETTTFWVSCTSEDECEGPRKPVIAVILTQIILTEVEGDSRCGPGVVELSASGCDGGTVNWYNAEEGGDLVANGPVYSPELLETTSFWVSCTSAEGCEGPRTEVIGTVFPLPTVTITPVENSVCTVTPAFQLEVTVDPTGGTGIWSSIPDGAVSETGLFDPSVGAASYVVTYSYLDPNGCPGLDEIIIEVIQCAEQCNWTPGFWKNHPEEICYVLGGTITGKGNKKECSGDTGTLDIILCQDGEDVVYSLTAAEVSALFEFSSVTGRGRKQINHCKNPTTSVEIIGCYFQCAPNGKTLLHHILSARLNMMANRLGGLQIGDLQCLEKEEGDGELIYFPEEYIEPIPDTPEEFLLFDNDNSIVICIPESCSVEGIAAIYSTYIEPLTLFNECDDDCGLPSKEYADFIDLSSVPISSPLNSISATERLNVYPNPASSQLMLQYYSPEAGEATIRIFDTGGKLQLLRQTEVYPGANSMELELSQLRSGMYVIQITDGEQISTIRFAISR